jgi:hypothetical protein
MKLQINTSGAWRNVVEFEADRCEAVLDALPEFARAINEDRARWCIVDDHGSRHWLGSFTNEVEASG